MVKKLLYIISLNIIFIAQGLSQKDSTRYYHWSLGISSGDILHELFNGDNTNKTYAAFVLEYAGQNFAGQLGFRPDYNMTDTQHEGFLDTEVTEHASFSGHLAGTTSIFSDRNWLIRAGLQLNGGWSQDDIIEDSGFDRVVTRRLQWNAGIGPVIDFRFFVHPRISLGTEASLLYSVTRSELQQIFTNFPDFNNTKETVEGDKITFVEPATIYLRFHF
jgi:hypothetical protein